MAKNPYLKISDIRGGINDADSPFSIAENEVVAAENIDFRAGMLGTKRGGFTAVSLSGSVFLRDVPTLRLRNKGSFTGAASGTISVGAFGASAANTILIVTISMTNTTTVTSVDLGGVALTLATQITNGANVRINQWYLYNPSISGGTLTVNLSGVADCAIIAERFTEVDLDVSPASGSSATGTSTIVFHTTSAFDPTYMVVEGTAWGAATLNVDTYGVINTDGQISGGGTPARASTATKIGTKPTNKFVHTLSGSVAWASVALGLKGLTLTSPRTIMALMKHEPSNTPSEDEIWAQDDKGRLDRRVGGVWQGGVPMMNYRVGSFFDGSYDTNAVSLHGKFFLALGGTLYATPNAGQGRGHVWDGTNLRHMGMWAGSTPTAADSGGAGSLSGTRYYRVRNVEVVNGVVVRRGEPSGVLTFIPSGANASITITKAAALAYYTEGETHWELEASVDNNLFYLLARTLIATTTVVDSTAYTVGYTAGELSEALTEYNTITAPRHVAVDEDRLIFGGDRFSTVNDSRVGWTPLRGDLGVGNDERQPATARFFLDLDGLSGGRLTHLVPAVMGGMMCFKNERIYKLIRSGNPNKAYNSIQLTPNRGAVMRSAASGTDAAGKPCIYFWDPFVGLCRWGERGCEDLMQKRRTLAARVNTNITINTQITARTIFYSQHWLVWVAISVDAATVPSQIACFNVRQGSWTDYTGAMTKIASWITFIDTNGKMTPLASLTAATTNNSKFGRPDQGVNDDGTRFRGFFRTKAFTIGELFSEFEIDGAMLHAKASAATIGVTAYRDLGLETKTTQDQSIAASGSETYTNAQFDDLEMAELTQVQIEVGDPAAYSGAQLDQTWTLESLVAKYLSGGERA